MAIALVVLGAARAEQLPAQALVARGDAMIAAGRIFAAESLYYAAVRREPENPRSRLALGTYLAARGALRVGAVLMEEALYFGADTSAVGPRLAPVYARLGEWSRLAALPGAPLTLPERRRVIWLRAHPPVTHGPDSSVVRYRVSDSALLGWLWVGIGPDSVHARIDARATGMILDPTWRRRHAVVRTFTAAAQRHQPAVAVALGVRIGADTISAVPVRFAPQPDSARAVVGLDILGAFTPTFDPPRGRVTLRVREPALDSTAIRVATYTDSSGVRIIDHGTLFPLGHPDVQRVLRTMRWTWDPPRGSVFVARATPAR